MEKREKRTVRLNGCAGCLQKCQWNGKVTSAESHQNTDGGKPYPCNTAGKGGRKWPEKRKS